MVKAATMLMMMVVVMMIMANVMLVPLLRTEAVRRWRQCHL